MKVLVLSSTFPRWAEDTEPRFVDYLCQYLSADNEIHVVVPHDKGIPTHEISSGNIQIFRFRYAPERLENLAYNGGILPNLRQNPVRLLLIPFFLLSQLALVIKLLRSEQYDIVHAHWIIPQGLIIRLASLILRSPPPFILTSHGGDLFALKGRVLGALKSWILNGAGAVTVVSSEMAKKVVNLGVPANKLQVIPMGVDSHETFCQPAPDSPRSGLIYVGRLVDKKGVEYLLRAIPRVLAKYPDESLTIVGDGPLRQELEELSRELAIEDSVSFNGAMVNKDIPPLLQRAAIAVIPSVVAATGDQEGAPVSIMETLACGCATIVSDYPGARDIITDEQNGLLVETRSPAQIAEKLCYLLDNPQVCAALGENGRATVVEGFDWRVISGKFQALFRSVVGH